VIRAALFSPPPFSPSKLAVSYLPGATPHGPLPLPPYEGGGASAHGGGGGGGGGGGSGANAATRTYTLTHNDLTGALLLSIGPRVNAEQVRGLYTRLVRDEVVAEWRFDGHPPAGLAETDEQRRRRGAREREREQQQRDELLRRGVGGAGSVSALNTASSDPAPPPPAPPPPPPSLHVYCHVSGEERWPAPPRLRAFVFRREMALVLAALRSADRALLAASPALRSAPVYVHFQSHVEHLDTVEAWGTLGDPGSWPGVSFLGGGGAGAGAGAGGRGGGGAAAASSSSAWQESLRRWAEGRPLLLALLGATATSDQSDSDGSMGEEAGGFGDEAALPGTAAAAAAAAGTARRRALLRPVRRSPPPASPAPSPPPPSPPPAAFPVPVIVARAAVDAKGGGGAAGAAAAAPSAGGVHPARIAAARR